MFSHIDPLRLSAIEKVLQAVLKGNSVTQVELMKGGYSSSQMYRVLTDENVYVLRVMGLDQPIEDRRQQHVCLQIASSIGLAPKVYYSNPESGIVVMECILHSEPYGSDWLLELARSLRQLHHVPQEFPKYLGPSHFLLEILSRLKKERLPRLNLPRFGGHENI